MPTMNLIESVNDALDQAMGADDRVVVMGEDVGKAGGVFRTTAGLQEKYGEERVLDTPLAESGIIGTAIGMALYGLRPVPEIQFQDFIFPGFDQIVSELAKIRYRSGGEFTAPVVIRTPYGGGIRGGHYHSQSGEAYFCHTAGLKVVIPGTPAEAKGLLLSAIADPDPVLFLEPKRVYRVLKEDVPEGDHRVPLGKCRLVQEGTDLSIIAYGAMLQTVKEAVEEAEGDGASIEVIDVRTLVPLDEQTIVDSVKKTGRALVVHEAPRICGFGAELVSLIAEKCFWHLEAPVLRVTGWDTPFPYTLEFEYLPSKDRVLKAVRKTLEVR